MAAVLYQFARSHFNEKARWALDYKGIVHERRNLLPGLHAFKMKRLSGLSLTPVLTYNRTVIAGSSQIAGFLDDLLPDARRLIPVDNAAEALGLVENLDEMLGPAVRTTVFSTIIDDLDYIGRIFGDDRGPLMQSTYRLLLRVFKKSLRRATGLNNPSRVATAKEESVRMMDLLGARLGPEGYLVGDRFSIADLTAAALLAPLANPDHADMRFPEPRPEAVEQLHAEMAQHPMINWVREIYRLYR